MTTSGRATLAQIAHEAGVSTSTVSRALRGRGEMAAPTRARILAAARRLGYAREDEPRGRPRTGTARLFDLVLGHYHDPYTDEVTAGAHQAAAELGYDLVLTAESDDPGDDWPIRVRGRGSAGVVLGLIRPTLSQLTVLRDAGIPIVLMEPPSEASVELTSVRTTDRAGAAEAAAHLIERGCTRFIVVAGAPAYRYGRARVEGFTRTVEELLPGAPMMRVQAGWEAVQARQAVLPALRSLPGSGPVGLFACSDEMAAGAYRSIAELGLRVPADVRVVGFDDVRGARYLQPGLTTVRQPIREMASAAVRALVDPDLPIGSVIELPTTLVVRGSTHAG